ncbi:MAG: sensor histidine kinase, partial [Christensenellales bacterium]
DKVQQMLMNLVANGINYTPEGGQVKIQLSSDEKQVKIVVSDTGIGIAEKDIPRLFERFYRVDKGRSRATGGTGLGLAIVKHVVMSMKGDIQVKSEVGKGSSFIVTLPKADKTEA